MTTLSTTQLYTFGYTGHVETVTIGTTGYYDITADGAQGGKGLSNGAGGLAALVSGEIYLAAGAKLEIVVGGVGGNGANAQGGGGGGSFVIETNGSGGIIADELIAGGGGGGKGGGGANSIPDGSDGAGPVGGFGGAAGAPGGGGGIDAPALGGGTFGGGPGGGGGFTGGNAATNSLNIFLGKTAEDGSDQGTTFDGGAGVSGGGGGGFGGGGGGGKLGGGGGGGYGGGGGGEGSSGGGGGLHLSGGNGGTSGLTGLGGQTGGYVGFLAAGGGGGGSYVNPDAFGAQETGGVHGGEGQVTIDYQGSSPPVISQASAPVITGAGGTTHTTAGSTTDTPFAGVEITDPNDVGNNAPTESLLITLSDSNAQLVPHGLDDGLTGVSAGTYELTEGLGVISGALDAITLIAPATLTGAVDGVETLTITLTDTSSFALDSPAMASVTVDILAPPPTITGASVTYTDAGESTDKPFAGVTVGDPNAGATDTLTITLSDANAALVDNGQTLTATSPGVYKLTGSAPAITSELNALTLQAPSTLTGAVNGVEALTFNLSDASSGYPGSPATATATAEILAPASTYTEPFGSTGQIETFTAPSTGYYDITASGAQGGSGSYSSSTGVPIAGGAGGLAAMASGDVYLQAGATLEIVVGSAGVSYKTDGGLVTGGGGGGGGGSFVIETKSSGSGGAVKIDEVIAGGGGGGAPTSGDGGGGAKATPTGGNGGGLDGGAGGAGGAAGAAGDHVNNDEYFGGGGGGFTGGAGDNYPRVPARGGSVSGVTFAGGSSTQGGGSPGGFGGGGQGGYAGGGGGGGGYGGGGGGGGGADEGGGGGGSFVAADALDAQETADTHSGGGSVTVTALAPPVILVASPAAHSTSGQVPVDPFAGDLITDANVGTPAETLTVTPSTTANGLLSAPDGGSVTNGIFSVTGTAQQVTTALDALVFTPSAGGDGTTTTFTISDTSAAYPLAVTDQTTSVADSVCYRAGSRILTERGEVEVERLAVGDHVITASGARRPIRWLGHRRIDCRRHPHPDRVLPVRIVAHAFGPGRPARDLYVSPGHAIGVDVIEQVLIPACDLVNGATIQQVAVDEVTYWHVELDSHDVLLAENLPAESYFDMGNRGFFAESGIVDLAAIPDPAKRTHADFCRPFHSGDGLVEVVRAQLIARAHSLGWTLRRDPLADLHLLVDGVRVDPVAREGQVRFTIPAGARDVWLASDAARPIDVGRGADWRSLGVCVLNLAFDDGFSPPRAISLDDPLLDEGFHRLERGGERVWRWTNGLTRLPAALWADCPDGCFLRLGHDNDALPRWIAPPGEADQSVVPFLERALGMPRTRMATEDASLPMPA